MEKTQEQQQLGLEKIRVITELLQVKVSYPKLIDEKKRGLVEPKVIGSFEASPFDNKDISYLKNIAMQLVDLHVNRNEDLVQHRELLLKEEKEKKQEELVKLESKTSNVENKNE